MSSHCLFFSTLIMQTTPATTPIDQPRKGSNTPQFTDTELDKYRAIVNEVGLLNLAKRSGMSIPGVTKFRDNTTRTNAGTARILTETIDQMILELLDKVPPKLIMRKAKQLLDAQNRAMQAAKLANEATQAN